MADDSELDHLRTFLLYACYNTIVKHFSEVKKISAINHTRRILILPGELIGVDGKFYTRRYKVQISETSEAALMETFNQLIEGIDDLNKGRESTVYYTGTSFDVSSEDTSPAGITWDGTNFWVAGFVNKEVFKYTSAGVYTSTYFDVSSEDTSPAGITWDGTYFLVTGETTKEVYKYTAAGVYTGEHFDVGDEDTIPFGICWDGIHLWVVGNDSKEVYKYRNFFSRPSILVYIDLKYGNKAFEHPKTKRWYQDIYLDVEWSTE